MTSRDALAGLVARDGARRIDLDLLPYPEAVDLLRALVGRRVDAEPAAAIELAARCAGLPLALRVEAFAVTSAGHLFEAWYSSGWHTQDLGGSLADL